jgi:hypothetical protein
MHLVQPGVGERHQAVFAATERWGGEKIGHQGFAEHQAAGSDHCYFGHSKLFVEGAIDLCGKHFSSPAHEVSTAKSHEEIFFAFFAASDNIQKNTN